MFSAFARGLGTCSLEKIFKNGVIFVRFEVYLAEILPKKFYKIYKNNRHCITANIILEYWSLITPQKMFYKLCNLVVLICLKKYIK